MSPEARVRVARVAQSLPLLLMVLLLVAVPLGLLVSYSFRESSFLGVGGGPTLSQYKLVFENSGTTRIMLRTTEVALAVAFADTALAFVVAYALRFRLKGRAALGVLAVVVASGFVSFLVRIFAWGAILGDGGLINSVLESLHLTSHPLEFLFLSYFAVGVTMTYLWLPLAVLVLFNAMEGIDRKTVEASRDLGAGRWRTLTGVVAPQARSGLIGTFLLVAVFTTGDYVTPELVGGSHGLTVGAIIQSEALNGGNLPQAAALMVGFLVLFCLSLIVLGGLTWVARRAARALRPVFEPAVLAATERFRSPIGRRSLSLPITALILGYLILPTVLVILFSFNAAQITGLPITGLTTKWYPEIVGRAGFSGALSNSLHVAIISVVCATFFGVPFAFALASARGWRRRLYWACVYLPFAVPGVLLGAAMFVAAEVTGVARGIALTATMHTVLLISEVVIIVHARLVGIDRHLVEAGRDLGSSAWGAVRRIVMPLLLPAIVGAALLSVAYSLDEILVTPFTVGRETTLPIWLLGQARQGFTPGIDALGTILLGGTLGAFALAFAVGRRAVVSAPEVA